MRLTWAPRQHGKLYSEAFVVELELSLGHTVILGHVLHEYVVKRGNIDGLPGRMLCMVCDRAALVKLKVGEL